MAENLVFEMLKRSGIAEAAALAARSFEDYCYFTSFFPDRDERRRIIGSIILHEYKANFGRAHYLVARQGGRMVAVAQLHAPDYRKPSDIRYFLHGWLQVYKAGDRKRIDEWLVMDAEAGKPCHEWASTQEAVWYASSLTVDPSAQRSGVGSAFLEEWERYVGERNGKAITLFTNSESNLVFYKKRGYEVFDERTLEHNGITMGSWSVRKWMAPAV
ncbi:MAG: GNAT family N-acetyltransferase [Bacteroidales bacterium]|nr:GNAT family N-acetyltransferase [Bacteroidales bacterium]